MNLNPKFEQGGMSPQELIVKKEGGYISYRKNKRIENIDYMFEMHSNNTEGKEWELQFSANGGFYVVGKGLDFAEKVMDEVASLIKEAESKEPLEKVELYAMPDSARKEDVEEFREKVLELYAEYPLLFEGFEYEDLLTHAAIKDGSIVIGNVGSSPSRRPLESYFASEDDISDLAKNNELFKALSGHLGLSSDAVDRLSDSRDRSEQRAKLFERTLSSRLPDYTVTRDGVIVTLSKNAS